VIIPNALGENLTPSVVSIGIDKEVFVGKVALERIANHPSRTFTAFKRTVELLLSGYLM
jgi:molecular chaperone HscC